MRRAIIPCALLLNGCADPVTPARPDPAEANRDDATTREDVRARDAAPPKDASADDGANFGCNARGSPVAICERTVACMRGCDDTDHATLGARESCERSCKARHARGCSAQFLAAVDFGSCHVFDAPP